MEGINMNAAWGLIHHPVVAEGKIEPICQKLHILHTLWQNIPKQINFFGGDFFETFTASATHGIFKLADIIYWPLKELQL